MNVLGSAPRSSRAPTTLVRSRFKLAGIFGAPPLHEFQIDGRDLSVSVFPGVLGPRPDLVSRVEALTELRATVFVGSLSQRRRPSCGQAAGRPRVRCGEMEAEPARARPQTGTCSSSSRTPARRGDRRRTCRRR